MLLSAVTLVERLRASLALEPREGLLPGDLMEGATDASKDAAVLVAVTDRDEPGVIFTVRREHLRTHAGQVSFPGGRCDPGEGAVAAALREADEEISLPAADIEILGALSPIDIPVSGFRLHPVVGASDRAPALVPADGEVARILEVPVDALMARGAVILTEREREGSRITVPAFRVGDDEIWGATAMVLAEFLVMLGWTGPSD